MRAYLRHLRRRGLLERDVAAAVQTPRGVRRLPRMPKKNEAAALLDGFVAEAERDDPRALRDLAIVELLYGAGLRVSECCGLDVDDVDVRRAPSPRSEKVQKCAAFRSASPPVTRSRATSAMVARRGPAPYNPVRGRRRRSS